jgi:WD40 repeat protein
VFDIETEKRLAGFNTNSADIHQLTWGPDGRLLACGAADHCAYVWNVGNREQRVFEGHQAHVVRVAFDTTGQLLATASNDGTTRLWDLWTREERVAALGGAVQFSRDGTRLAHGLLGNAAGWWNIAACSELRTFQGHTTYEVYQVATHPRRPIAASLGSSSLRLWDIDRGRQIAMLPGDWLHLGFEPQSGDLVVSGKTGEYRAPLDAIDERSQEDVVDLSSRLKSMSRGASCFTEFSAKGDMRLSQDCDTEAATLTTSVSPNAQPWSLPRSLQHPALSPDGLWVANKPGSGGVDIWSIRDRRNVVHLLENARNLTIQFSRNGRWLVTGSPSEYVIWDTSDWQPRRRVPRDNVSMVVALVAFAPDGRTAALANSAFDIRLIDLNSGAELATLPSRQGQPRPEFCFSADGRYLLQVGPKLTLLAWDLDAIRRQLRQMGLDW